ncbi:MAG: fibronectin type III domain-containing protein [Veillonellaceae bacterium]|nr:fibronectin type III domain-containing protein [Veillonellaceae bacterium]
MSLPADNGAAITDTGFWVYNAASGGSVVWSDGNPSPVTSVTATGLPSNQDLWLEVKAQNSAGWSAASARQKFTTLPLAPSAPTISSLTRVSDTQHTINLIRHDTPGAPYWWLRVMRRVFSGTWSGWTTIANPYAGISSYTDSGTTPERLYEWKIEVSNPSGSAASNIARAYTSPPPPPSVSAVRDELGQIVVTVAQPSPYWDELKTHLQISTDGGATYGAPIDLARALSYTVTSPTPSVYMFRARSYNDDDGKTGDGLTSAWVVSNAVDVITRPNPPSSLSPNGAVFDATEARTFSWQHNPVDTTSQTSYEVRYRESGASTWTTTGQTTSSVSEHTFPADTFTNGASWEWQVRTWGADEDPSDWSPTATFTTSAAPTATIQSPEMGSTLTGATCTLVWVFYDADGTAQSQWRAGLIRDGITVETRSGTGTASTVTFTTRLDNSATYTARVQVRDGSGLWSEWDTTTFTTDFAEPAAPVVSLSWDADRGAVVVSIENTQTADLHGVTLVQDTDGVWAWTDTTPTAPTGLTTDTDCVVAVDAAASDLALVLDTDGVPAAVAWSALTVADTTHNTVERSIDGGQTWTVVADGVAVDGSVSDATVPLGVDALYRAIAWSDLPSSATGEAAGITAPATSGFWAAGGVTVRIMQRVGAAPIIDSVRGLSTRVLHRFAGRTFPVETAGTARSRTASVAFSVSAEDMALVEQLAFAPAPHLIRAPDGQVIWASISDVDTPRVGALDWWDVGFTATEIEP